MFIGKSQGAPPGLYHFCKQNKLMCKRMLHLFLLCLGYCTSTVSILSPPSPEYRNSVHIFKCGSSLTSDIEGLGFETGNQRRYAEMQSSEQRASRITEIALYRFLPTQAGLHPLHAINQQKPSPADWVVYVKLITCLGLVATRLVFLAP